MLNYSEPKTIEEVYAQPLWQNKLILIEGQMVNYSAWREAGITNISHIIDNNGKLAFKFC